MTTQYFAGNSMAHFDRSTTAIVEDTTSGRFDSTYVPSAIKIPNGEVGFAQSATFSATGTVWVRQTVYLGNTGNNTGPALYNGSTPVFRTEGFGSNTLQAQYWNGSAWTSTGSFFSITSASLNIMVWKIILNTSFEVYLGGTLIASGSGWSGGSTTATNIRCYATGVADAFFSEIMVADYDIRDSHYAFSALNGNSAANTGGSGTYTDVNETVVNDSTSIDVSVVANKMGQTHAALTVPSGYVIKAMVIGGRGRVSGGTVTDGKLGCRGSSGTNSSGSALSYNGGYSTRERLVLTDPDTSAIFTQSGYNASEIYEEAV